MLHGGGEKYLSRFLFFFNYFTAVRFASAGVGGYKKKEKKGEEGEERCA